MPPSTPPPPTRNHLRWEGQVLSLGSSLLTSWELASVLQAVTGPERAPGQQKWGTGGLCRAPVEEVPGGPSGSCLGQHSVSPMQARPATHWLAGVEEEVPSSLAYFQVSSHTNNQSFNSQDTEWVSDLHSV